MNVSEREINDEIRAARKVSLDTGENVTRVLARRSVKMMKAYAEDMSNLISGGLEEMRWDLEG